MNRLSLDRATLQSAAEESTGLSNWDDEKFFEAIDILLHSLRTEARLSAKGADELARRLFETMRQRLMVIEDRKRWPEVAEVRIDRPIIVTGNGRSGTTLLHNLLALAPGHRGVKYWEMMRPSPPPTAAAYDSDPRIDEIEQLLIAQGFKSASTMAKHPYGADRMEECTTSLELAGVGGYLGAVANVPSFTRYRENVDFRSPYRFHRMVVQHLLWRGPPGRVVLKAPEHMFHLPELLDVYPDAMIVVAHRDPARSVASLISIVAQMRGLFTDQPDVVAVKEQRFGYHRIMNRLAAIRQALDRPGRFFDVQFVELNDDPLTTLQRLYAQMGLEFGAVHRGAITAYMKENPRHRFGQHRYSLDEYGISFAEIDEAFGPYIADNHVILERAEA